MEQRFFKRVPEKIRVDFYHNNKTYEGTVTNLSCTGLHIKADMCPTNDTDIEVVLILGDEVYRLPARVTRRLHANDLCCCGTELRDTSSLYCEFVSTIQDYQDGSHFKKRTGQ